MVNKQQILHDKSTLTLRLALIKVWRKGINGGAELLKEMKGRHLRSVNTIMFILPYIVDINFTAAGQVFLCVQINVCCSFRQFGRICSEK